MDLAAEKLPQFILSNGEVFEHYLNTLVSYGNTQFAASMLKGIQKLFAAARRLNLKEKTNAAYL